MPAWSARLRHAGAVFVGKNNLHEFAYGTTNEDSAFGPVRNPHDPSRSPGGSSGGSAVSVAAGMAFATIVLILEDRYEFRPAACGVVGLKPRLRRNLDRRSCAVVANARPCGAYCRHGDRHLVRISRADRHRFEQRLQDKGRLNTAPKPRMSMVCASAIPRVDTFATCSTSRGALDVRGRRSNDSAKPGGHLATSEYRYARYYWSNYLANPAHGRRGLSRHDLGGGARAIHATGPSEAGNGAAT